MVDVVWLMSCAGHPNFGDDAMHFLWHRHYRKIYPQSFIVNDPHRDSSRNLFDNISDESTLFTSIFFNTILNLYRDIRNIPSNDQLLDYLVDHYRSDFHVIRNRFKNGKGRIHLIGGGYINALFQNFYGIFPLVKGLSQILECEVVATGQGLVPFNQDELEILYPHMPNFSIFDTRDKISFEVSQKLIRADRHYFSGDDILIGLGASAVVNLPLRVTSESSLIVNIQQDLFSADQESLGTLNKILINVSRKRALRSLVIVKCMNADWDKEMFVHNGLDVGYFDRVSVIEPDATLTDGLPISGTGFMVTTRYHPHLIAALVGAQGAFMATTPYYIAKHQAALEMGSFWNGLDLTHETRGMTPTDSTSARPETALRNWFVQRKRALLEELSPGHPVV